mmetsp:Transcript_42307/g.104219  ORF Transcript_42307/g.104219 Transcript_42307/m.104219 type:complete len:90 (+) Transcript_42307:129-398(+)
MFCVCACVRVCEREFVCMCVCVYVCVCVLCVSAWRLGDISRQTVLVTNQFTVITKARDSQRTESWLQQQANWLGRENSHEAINRLAQFT